MERFVVGTGRCGSTLCSLMLGEHRSVLGINEFFTGLDWGRRFAPGDMTGEELADLIATPNPVTTDALSRGYTAEEIVYPFRTDSRFGRADPVPWVLITTLSRLSDDPDELFDETVAAARSLAPAPAGEQYRRLFAWLTARLGREVWIERSGSSIDYLPELAELYPDARFVHLHRDGHEAALSIRAHPFYRLAVSLLYPGLLPDMAEGEDEVVALLESVPDIEWFGRYWTDQLARGMRALARLDPDRYLEIRFEDLVTSPREISRELARFFELPPDDGFPERAAALVRGAPPTRFEHLTAEEQERLHLACRPGRLLLGQE